MGRSPSATSISSSAPDSARLIVARALGVSAAEYPLLKPRELDLRRLSGAERRLALAIQRTAIQRWITLEFLLDRHLSQPMRRIEPALQGVLLAGAAQIVALNRLPVHAIVNESVNIARTLVRPGAAKLVNAVLRRVAGDLSNRSVAEPWTPRRDRLPLDDGFVLLAGPILPPTKDLAGHLAIATSCPKPLVRQWLDSFDASEVIEVCRHGVASPPVIVAVEQDPGEAPCHPHELPGYYLWDGTHQQLIEFIDQHPQRRVQDPGSAQPVAATASLQLSRIIDYCAGRGTKTRQIAVMHPQASVIATDIDDARRAVLSSAMANMVNVTVVAPDDAEQLDCAADLLILDVPCTNSAALGRRSEARYRCGPRQVESLVALQRRIISHALPLVRPGGWVLYCTCSLDPKENQQQAAWLARQSAAAVVSEQLLLPRGCADAYHDGSYAALIQLP
jgi:16S rRNA (cytosine967-C5)-methyltransferase